VFLRPVLKHFLSYFLPRFRVGLSRGNFGKFGRVLYFDHIYTLYAKTAVIYFAEDWHHIYIFRSGIFVKLQKFCRSANVFCIFISSFNSTEYKSSTFLSSSFYHSDLERILFDGFIIISTNSDFGTL